jgi:hypothetical protein
MSIYVMSISDLNNDDYDRGWMDGRDSAEKEIESLQAENDKMRKAILSWWRGSPEDTVSEKELYRIATGLEKVSD